MFSKTLAALAVLFVTATNLVHAESFGMVAKEKWELKKGMSKEAQHLSVKNRVLSFVNFLTGASTDSPFADGVSGDDFAKAFGFGDAAEAGASFSDKEIWYCFRLKRTLKTKATWGQNKETKELAKGKGKTLPKGRWVYTTLPEDLDKIVRGKTYLLADLECLNCNEFEVEFEAVTVRTLHEKKVLHEGDKIVEKTTVVPGKTIVTERTVQGPDRYVEAQRGGGSNVGAVVAGAVIGAALSSGNNRGGGNVTQGNVGGDIYLTTGGQAPVQQPSGYVRTRVNPTQAGDPRAGGTGTPTAPTQRGDPRAGGAGQGGQRRH